MKNSRHLFILFLPVLLGVSSLTSCSNNKADIIIHALNCEDYIGEDELTLYDENDEPMNFQTVIKAFEAVESKKLGKKVSVVYDTYDTNETMLSSLKTGKNSYDVICASDYTIQKMMSMDMFQKLNKDNIPNFFEFTPTFLQDSLNNIKATVNGVEESVGDYSIGYMWGTVGVLYNPEKVAKDKGLEEDEVKYDLASWESLWNDKYRSEMSIKDSMRDTYSVGVMYTYRNQIERLLELSGCFEEGTYDLKQEDGVDYYELALNGKNISKNQLFNEKIFSLEEINAIEGDYLSYNQALTAIFNRCDSKSVNEVKKALLELKEKVFGFEVDSGKDDITKGLIGMNLAWSGDAVYSIEVGEEESDRILYFSLPRTGGNIWFDSWGICKGVEGANLTVSEDFLNFLSMPAIAAANMETIGYTSFIGGEDVHSLIREWYDPRFFTMYAFDDNDEVIVDDDDNYVYAEGMENSTYEKACYEGEYMDWDTFIERYNEDNPDDELEWNVRNLTYMFKGTLDVDESKLGNTPSTNPYLFYTDEIENIDGDYGEIGVGRYFVAQYPDQNVIPKLAIMKDYGDNNKFVLDMWSDVKSNNLPLFGVIIFGVILAAAATLIIVSFVTKHQTHKLRVQRRKESAAYHSKK